MSEVWPAGPSLSWIMGERVQVAEPRLLGRWGRLWITLVSAAGSQGPSGGLCMPGRQGRLEGQGSQLEVLGRETQGVSMGRPTDRGGVQRNSPIGAVCRGTQPVPMLEAAVSDPGSLWRLREGGGPFLPLPAAAAGCRPSWV